MDLLIYPPVHCFSAPFLGLPLLPSTLMVPEFLWLHGLSAHIRLHYSQKHVMGRTASVSWVPSRVGVGWEAGERFRVQPLWEDPLEKEMVTYSSILAWKISWTEDPGTLQSMGSQRVGHDLATKQLRIPLL